METPQLADDDAAWSAQLDALEARVRATAVARQHYTGANIRFEDGTLFMGFTVEDVGIDFDAAEAIAVLMLLDNSIIAQDVTYWNEPDGQPEGVYFHSRHAFIDPDWEENVTGVYFHKDKGAGLYLSGVYLHHIFFRDGADVPARLLSAGFALMAIYASRLGFTEISLLAAGGAPRFAEEWPVEGMIGFYVWPKFGFDAPVAVEELADAPHLQGCQTVQEIVQRDARWWQEDGGQGRTMTFDLSVGSAAWGVLLDYLEPWLQAEEQSQ